MGPRVPCVHECTARHLLPANVKLTDIVSRCCEAGVSVEFGRDLCLVQPRRRRPGSAPEGCGAELGGRGSSPASPLLPLSESCRGCLTSRRSRVESQVVSPTSAEYRGERLKYCFGSSLNHWEETDELSFLCPQILVRIELLLRGPLFEGPCSVAAWRAGHITGLCP